MAHVALYAWIFHRLARWAGAAARGSRVRTTVGAVLVVLTLFALSFAPIYIEGENLASGHRAGRNAYQAYRDAVYDVFRVGRPAAIPADLVPQPRR